MQKEIRQILNEFKQDERKLNQIIVTLFLKANSIKVNNNILIKSLELTDDEFKSLFDKRDVTEFGLDDVIQSFELAIPDKEQTTNGAVYTPKRIKDFIVKETLKKLKSRLDLLKAGDISCGCGAFFFTLAKNLCKETQKSYQAIFRENLYGLDISQGSIDRTKILLSLLAITEGEDIEEFSFNLYTSNALSFDWFSQVPSISENHGFDLIVGNPPYVRAKNLHNETKSLLSNWSVTKSGNPDLYIPFFEIGKSNLNKNGILGYITVNTFYKSVNARALRKFFEDQNTDLKIIDFGHEKIFGNKSAYTCICFISNQSSENISYARFTSTRLEEFSEDNFHTIPYKSVDSHKGWILSSKEIIENINKIESCGPSLEKLFKIKNGIATLSNDIFIFRPIDETKEFYYFKKNEKEYQVEKMICRDIIKPNVLKSENEIDEVREKIIYPYTNGITPLRLLKEDEFRTEYPLAYAYLSDFKSELLKRDKGNGDYSAWFAFGRTQALTDKGYKLMFPYMAKEPHFVYTNNENMLIYCGYAIFSESQEELLLLKKILQSRLFDYYMKHTSKPYSGGYFSYAKNYVKNFSICDLNEDEKQFLKKTSNKIHIDRFLESKYSVSLS